MMNEQHFGDILATVGTVSLVFLFFEATHRFRLYCTTGNMYNEGVLRSWIYKVTERQAFW